jgi:hypothetical protein
MLCLRGHTGYGERGEVRDLNGELSLDRETMSATETTAQSQTVTVFTSQKVNIGFFGIQTSTGTLNKSIFWDPSNYALVKAVMSFDASQSYLSGASAYVLINGIQAAPTISWGAFATGERTQTQDVTTQIDNGSNSFECWYKIAFGALGNESCSFDLSITVTLQYIGPAGGASSNPIGSGSTTPSLSNLWSQIKGSSPAERRR